LIDAPPATDHRGIDRLLETSLSQPVTEPVVLGPSRHLTHDVNIIGGAGRRGAGFGQPEVDRGAADEDHVLGDRAEKRRRGLELLGAHFPPLLAR
jgi:hypothetical protein